MFHLKKLGLFVTILSLSSSLIACEGHDCCHLKKDEVQKATPRRSIDSYKTIATSRVAKTSFLDKVRAIELYNGMKFEFKEQGFDCRGARIEVRQEIVKSKFSIGFEEGNFVVSFGNSTPTLGEYILLIDDWEYPATRVL